MSHVRNDDKLVYFQTTYRKFPGDVEGLDWSAVYFQKLRFDALIDGMGEAELSDSILDVGCGIGDLSSVLGDFDNYVGVDRVPEMVRQARRRYPSRTFYELDLAEVGETFDWVLASQVLNHRTRQNHDALLQLVEKMWSVCSKGVAFNVRVPGAGVKNLEGPELFEYDPALLLTDCRKISRTITCRIDYLPHDATFHLFR